MGKHLSQINIVLGEGKPIRYNSHIRRVPYTLSQYGVVIKRGSGIGNDGAFAAANKALKRLAAKGIK